MNSYSGGRICRIKLQNFLTYDNLEVFPSAGLNLIIGLNGTGKSSIVCGICLGLAGKPQFTGRATQISDYIKHGCKSAEIEIELESLKSSNVIINRKIKQDKKSIWTLNGKLVQINAITEAVTQFNIQTNNLCQFLPQEKVAEFSKMNKKERLENMLEVIGDQNLLKSFNELKDLQNGHNEHKNGISDLENQLEIEKQKNDRLKAAVDRHEEKACLQDNLTILEDQKKILQYQEISEEYRKIKKLKSEKKQEKNRLKSQSDSLLSVKDNFHSEQVDYRQKIEAVDNTINQAARSVSKSFQDLTMWDESINNAKLEFHHKIEEKNDQKKSIHQLKEQISGLQRGYDDSLKASSNIKDKEEELKKKIKQLQDSKADIMSKKGGFTIDRNQLYTTIAEITNEITKLKNEENKRMQVLSRIDGDTYQAAQWIQRNMEKFKGLVHLPILTTIKVSDDRDVKFIENHIPFRDMIAFVCEDQDDSKLLVKILREEKNLAVNTVMAPTAPLSSFIPRHSNTDLQRMSFRCYLKDLFTAPEGVMKYLCSLHNIHQTPVGDERAENFIKDSSQGNQRFPFNVCYTTNHRYNFRNSKYGQRNLTVTTSNLRNPHLLISSRDVTERLQKFENNLKELHRQRNLCEEEIAELCKDEGKLSKEIEVYRKELKDYEDKERSLRTLATNLEQRKQKLKTYESQVIDEKEERRLASEQISSLVKKKLHCMQAIHDQVKVLLTNREEKLKMSLYYSSLNKKVAKHERLIREASEKYENAVKSYEETKSESKLIHDKALSLYSQVQNKTENEKEALKLGNFRTVEEIEQEIQVKKAQIDLTDGTDESVIIDYKRRAKAIDSIEKTILKHQAKLSTANAGIQEKKEKWLKLLEFHIKKINEKFKYYFKLLKCAGEINLDTDNNSNDFEKYGLQILLKYRDSEPLLELSQNHHSGGECSVAAILFILSLQELTEVPFRCIDEINQGMDSINERKVFELISQSASNKNSSQYFLLTPKLLPGLSYHENMKIHVIYNGPYLELTWCLKDILRIRENLESD